MSKKVICPHCWHEETLSMIKQEQEVVHDDPRFMVWKFPYGGAWASGNINNNGGWWRCDTCDMDFTPSEAAHLIDAVLRVSNPDSDSYNKKENLFEDSLEALKGGKE